MAERSRFYDSVTGDRVYGSATWAQVLGSLHADGIIAGWEDEYAVTQHGPPAMSVDVALGACIIQGYHHEVYSAASVVTIGAADPTNPRIDRLVVRRSMANRASTLFVIAGTPAASPTAPAISQDVAGDYDLPIAQIRVDAAVLSIVTAKITDERGTRTTPRLAAPDVPSTATFADAAATGDGPALAYDDHVHAQPSLVPTGAIMPYGATSAPTGWLLCDGSAVSRATYAALFAVVGTSFGVGNGTTTFNVPDLRGRAIFGYKSTDTAFDALGETGGAQTHTHAGHDNHAALTNNHSGVAVGTSGAGSSHTHAGGAVTGTAAAEASHTHAGTGVTGSDGSHVHAGSGSVGYEGGHTHSGSGVTGGDSGHFHDGGAETGGSGGHSHTLGSPSTIVAGVAVGAIPVAGSDHTHSTDSAAAHTHTTPATGWAASSHYHAASNVGSGSAHTHTMGDVGSAAAHTHGASAVSAGTSHAHGAGSLTSPTSGAEASHTHAAGTVTQPAAHGAISAHSAHDTPSHLPPYMALPFIIKT